MDKIVLVANYPNGFVKYLTKQFPEFRFKAFAMDERTLQKKYEQLAIDSSDNEAKQGLESVEKTFKNLERKTHGTNHQN